MNISDAEQEMQQEQRRLFSQCGQTEQAWKDKVQTRYYGEFIDPYQKVIPDFIRELKVLNETMEKAKKKLSKAP